MWTQWGNYSSHMYTMEAIDRIRGHTDPNSSLFLYVAYQAVHSANMREDPLQAPHKWIKKFKHIKHRGRRKYAAMVAYMDHGVGKVLLLHLLITYIEYFFSNMSRFLFVVV